MMQVFLRHNSTGYYYRGSFEWVAESRDAGDFRNVEHAFRVIIRDHLDGMSLVLRYDGTRPEQVFDLAGDDLRGISA